MITCPYCGTSYSAFQPNCSNCGAPLQAVGEVIPGASEDNIPIPPSPPRPISDRYAYRLLSTEGWSVSALVFTILGIIFTLLGAALTLAIVTAFVGIPFLALGLVFLGGGAAVLFWRYQEARKLVNVLRMGEATRGQVMDVHENYNVRVNGRNPWVIKYQFQANGQNYEGKVTTLNQPGPELQTGKPVCILYLPASPNFNSLYPHP